VRWWAFPVKKLHCLRCASLSAQLSDKSGCAHCDTRVDVETFPDALTGERRNTALLRSPPPLRIQEPQCARDLNGVLLGADGDM
jgi:hypothetical protein